MKKALSSILVICTSIFLLVACGGKAPSWQEQYDLGIRYLSEGNYQEAIITFTAAIEIDPKQPVLYIGRADAYIGLGETTKNLSSALADYENAIELDDSNVDAWLGIADVYIRQGEYDLALDVLKDALSKTSNDERITEKISAMEAGTFADRSGKTRKSVHIENGEVIQYWLYEYDERGYNVKTTNYDSDGTLTKTEISEFDEDGLEIRSIGTSDKGNTTITSFEYDTQNRCVKEVRENTHTTEHGTETDINYTIISYDDVLRTETLEDYYIVDGVEEFGHRFVIEYDENWIRRRGSNYYPDENGELYLDYYVEYIWNDDGSYGGFEHFQVAPREQDSDVQ